MKITVWVAWHGAAMCVALFHAYKKVSLHPTMQWKNNFEKNISICHLFEKDPKQLLSKLPCQFHILKLLGLFRECSPCWKAHSSWHHWQLATFFNCLKRTITAVTYQLQDVATCFFGTWNVCLPSGPNNHQVAPNQRPIRAFSFNLENLWKFPPKHWDVSSPLERSYQTYYQEVTVFPCLLCQKCI